MAGRNSVQELDNNPNIPSDSLLAQQVINEAYLDCYFPQPYPGNPTPPRPRWALWPFALRFSGPVTASIGVTQGSNVITGGYAAFTTAMIGSFVQLGGSFYTWAGIDSGGAAHFVEPVNESSGTYSVTLFHCCYNLSTLIATGVGIAEVQKAPVVEGWGIVTPMNSRAEEWRWKAILYGDFNPEPGGGSMFSGGTWPGGINYPTGTPMFYRIDNAPKVAGNAPSCLFHVEPMCDRPYVFDFEAWVTPVPLVNGSDTPILPSGLMIPQSVLLPLCREKWAEVYKKYSGMNVAGLQKSADGARRILSRLGGGQRDREVRMPLNNI